MLKELNIKFIIPSVLAIALLGAICWFIYSPDFEPAITAFGLLAAISAIYIDRILADNERRRELLIALAHEIYMNIGVLKDIKTADEKDDKKPNVLPRLYTSTVKGVISTGIFTSKKDKKLWKLITAWLQFSEDFNIRLGIHEMNAFSNIAFAKQLEVKVLQSASAKRTMDAFNELYKCVFNEYTCETNIDENTILFDT